MGVGMYQHDVDQSRLRSAAEGVVDDCVNAVGVNPNTATYFTLQSLTKNHSNGKLTSVNLSFSLRTRGRVRACPGVILLFRVPLLKYVSGLDSRKAESIVFYRNKHGRFETREDLLKVEGIGPKTFELSAGFLRIFEGSHPFDATGIHPESYEVALKFLGAIFLRLKIGNEGYERLDLAKECLKNGSELRRKLVDELKRFQISSEAEMRSLSEAIKIPLEDLKDLTAEFQHGYLRLIATTHHL
jgi:uncharacterized protein